MNLKIKNNELKIPNWLVFMGLLVADSMYANHCRKKAVVKYLDTKCQKSDEKEES